MSVHRHRAATSALFMSALLLASSNCGEEDRCIVDSDCVNSRAARKAGRCAPEVWCSENVCKAACRDLCTTADDSVNACDDGLVCTQSRETDLEAEAPRCTRLPIICETEQACPLYRPLDEEGTQREWACVDGFCRYPGLDL